ncbi:MAG: hypothetical protein J5580_00670 [Clostridia bacterium]|nr:hypothetical protein [Clostridia bacterium]
MAKFFTKKVCLITLAVVVALGGVIWAIVANITPKFRSGITAVPSASQVSGNGTAAVMVDNYLYFVGGKVTTSTIKYGDNEYYANAQMPDAGIYRVQIGDHGQPSVTYTYDNTDTNEKGEKVVLQEGDAKYNTKVVGISDWEKIGQKHNGIEAVVPKIAGHDQTAMWVFGKYLIYTSPHNRLDNRGNLMTGYLDFFRVDLDGKNHTLIYTTDSTALTTKDFTVWSDADANIYLLVADQTTENESTVTTIKKINVKTQKTNIIDTKVSNVVLPRATQYKNDSANENLAKVYGGVMANVFYTKASENNSNENIMYRCAIVDGEPTVVASGADTTFTPLAVTPMNVAGNVGGAQFVFSVKIPNLIPQNLCVIQNLDTYHYETPASSAAIGLGADDKVAIYANGFCTKNGELYHYTIENSRVVWDQENNAAKRLLPTNTVEDNGVLTVINDKIYLQSGNAVYVVDKNGNTQTLSFTTNTASNEAETTDKEESSTETANTLSNTLPLAVLYQPQGNTGDPLIFVADADYVRLYHTDQTFDYLRFYGD